MSPKRKFIMLLPFGVVLYLFATAPWPGPAKVLVKGNGQVSGSIDVGITEERWTGIGYAMYKIEPDRDKISTLQQGVFKTLDEVPRDIVVPTTATARISNCRKLPSIVAPNGQYIAYCSQRVEPVDKYRGNIFDDTFSIETAATHKILLSARLRHPGMIRAICWSPDSQKIAILSEQSRGAFGIVGTIVGFMLGHPTPYITYVLDVYTIDGNVAYSIVLGRNSPNGRGIISGWTID